ncbi:MAG: ferredoxin [bacterium]|nr:ferredoxin [bacterium]
MIIINEDACIGCGACEATCPNVFKINQQGKSEVISQSNFVCAKNAAENCPTQAIEVK